MNTLISLIIYLIVMGLVPCIVGALFKKILGDSLIRQYVCGFIIMLSLFQVVCIPVGLCGTSFSIVVWIYSVALFLILTFVFFDSAKGDGWKRGVDYSNKKNRIIKMRFSVYEYVYLTMFVCIFAYMVYMTLNYSGVRWNGDDFTYIAYSNDAIFSNKIYMTSITGRYNAIIPASRMFQSYNFFISYLAIICRCSVAEMARGYLAINLMIITFMSIWLLSEEIIIERDNRLIFLLLAAVVYLFGESSYFSTTYRLLGPIWQGKAILAIIFQPLLLLIFPKFIQEKYDVSRGVFLFVFSNSAVCLTLGGIFTMIVNTIGITFVCLIAFKKSNPIIVDKKNYLYLLWANILPVIYGALYWGLK